MLVISCYLFSACSKSNIKFEYTDSQGKFDKSNTEIMTNEYTHKSLDIFSVFLNIDLTEGKVDWEILNPSGEAIYKGNVSSEGGKLYKQLTYPKDYAIKEGLDKKVKVVSGIEYGQLIIKPTSSSAVYKIILKPVNAEGSYTIKWSNKLPSN